ncbi:3-hydroxyacyl-CoA dehydrogenase family protein [Microlunatus soli]|uniref:3-hydroxyacyl-CoA dehydrogenase n=1 Tax=Microlunatus soli TaxID=630515 RepID=A0A1H1V0P2_9ACTN|nr:3-hydroxyacyl-CoA dehydrogenase family protein [Microlunatus soli]SDS77926.1 3-hydroxyacyl-CoA dehydrogenase [Microlunatus soli]
MTVLPRKIGVYGGGRMGAGIAQAFAVAGADVVIIEADDQAGIAARQRIEKVLATSAEKAGVTAGGTVEVSSAPSDLAGLPLVIEAVPEVAELKRSVLATIAEQTPSAMIASNTSALPIDELADALTDPSRLIGLHFFNPVPVSQLVEVVVGSRTDHDLMTRARGLVEALGKQAITVTDSPGFASSRLGVALALEAIRMLADGVASAEDIDAAMTLGYRHPTGPLRTTDIVGLDVRLAIAEHLERQLGQRFSPPQLLRDKVARGELGRKTGQGFYRW